MTLLKSYYHLCKPNVVYMMLICAFVGMLLAEQTVTSYGYLFISLTGIALCSASAAAINQVVDRKTDASMTRTCLLYTSPSPRDGHQSRMPSSA